MTAWLGPLAPLAPALVISAGFITTFLMFVARVQLFGMPRDADVDRRVASKVLGRFLRHYFMWLIRPVESTLVQLKVSPNSITLASLGTAGASAWAAAQGRFALAGWLYLFTGILDIFDGRVARASGRVSPGGAYFDSVMDRYAELLVFGGFAYFYRDSWMMGVVLLGALGSIMVSYTRARAEGLGIDDVNVGTMQRPERIVVLGISTALAPIPEALYGHGQWPVFPVVVVAMSFLALSANLTAVRRILHTLARLDEVHGQKLMAAATPLPRLARPLSAPAPANDKDPEALSLVLPLRAAAPQ